MRPIVLTTIVFVLTACTSVRVAAPEYQTGSYPQIGEPSTAAAGEVMVARWNILSRGVATLLAPVDGSFWANRRGAAAGESLVLAMASGRALYCQSTTSIGAPCLHDSDNDQRFDRVYTINIYGGAVAGRTIDPVPYRVGAQDRAILDGFKYELIYQGIDSGVVRVAYREYTDNLARPAFAQDLTYTLDVDGTTNARFRDLALTIHAADNNQIRYTVTAGFQR